MDRRRKPKKVMAPAKRPPARKSPKDDSASVSDLAKRLAESLERERAAGEILRVISSSPASVQPTFEAIARAAMSLCEADIGSLFRFDGQLIHVAAFHGTPEETEASRRAFPQRPSHGSVTARAILAAAVVQIDDVSKDPEAADALRMFQTVLSVPMIRDGRPLGAITVARRVVRPFSDEQIGLLQTFADQAVIAIENVRLFKELQARNQELTVALAQQTATSEVLAVISGAQTAVQPVFEAIVQSARRLCDASYSSVYRLDGQLIHLVAHNHQTPAAAEVFRDVWPMPLTGDSFVVRAIRESVVIHTDMQADPTASAALIARGMAVGHRRILVVPMVHEGQSIGAIRVSRGDATPFAEQHIALLKTFADQAVIAIENGRLFKELQASNRDLVTALDKQTATSEILRAMSGSLTDVQPVFDTIVGSGLRLLGGYSATMMLLHDGDSLDLVAYTSTSAEADASLVDAFPLPLCSLPPGERAVHDRRPHAVEDVESAPDVTNVMRETGRARGWHSNLFIPMIREDVALGLISITRRDPGPFAADEIALLETFAAQAVIAIENVRLFTELQGKNLALSQAHAQVSHALEQQTATSEILSTIAHAQSEVQPVFDTIVRSAARLCQAAMAAVFLTDGRTLYHPANYGSVIEALAAARSRYPRPLDRETVPGLAILTRSVIHVPDIEEPSALTMVRDAGRLLGFRSTVSVPMLREGEAVGTINVARREPGSFSDAEVTLLKTFADQAVIAIENVRLFRELEAANRGLAAASQHKSEFLANMSHELRTPLNAIIGYSELLEEEAADLDSGRLVPDLQKIAVAAKHQLSLINDILDLSKIEAGRMELEPSDFDVPSAIENALTLVRERATRRGIVLGRMIDDRVGVIQGDERKVKQVLLNLLSNALKFTPEGGRIDVAATVNDGMVEVSVADTGVGIAPEDQEAVFEEFRQVGTADKKVEGTGLGLALSRKFIELHDGRIWVKSQVGMGSTFTFTLPVRHEPGDQGDAPTLVS